MKPDKLTVALRTAMGLMFVAGPLTTALHLAPEPALAPGAAAFLAALSRTGYMLPLLWGTEIAAGALLLAGLMVPLGLILLAPVIVNIAGFHLFLAPKAIAPAIVACTLELFLAWKYREEFAPLFRISRAQQRSRASDFKAHAA